MRGNNLPEIRLVAFGDWIHSYLSPRQSVDCNPSPDIASSTTAATFPVVPLCNPDRCTRPFLLDSPDVYRRYQHRSFFLSRRGERETAKSHGNFKHRRFVSALSSVSISSAFSSPGPFSVVVLALISSIPVRCFSFSISLAG